MSQFTRQTRALVTATIMMALAVTAVAPTAAQTEDAVLVDELVAIERSKLDPWYGEASTGRLRLARR